MTRKLMLVLAAIAVVSASGAAYFRANGTAGAPQVATAAVTRGAVVETVEATGTLEAVETVEVGTQVSGTIQALHADFNSVVRRGQLIAELEPSLLQTQVEQAEATVARLQADVDRAEADKADADTRLRRARELSARQLISASDLEAAETAARQAEAASRAARAQVVQSRASLNQSRVNLGHARITAPIDGIVISRNVDVGQTVAASMQAPTLFVLARDLASMQVNAKVDESDIGRIEADQPVEFRVDAYPQERFAGTVRQVRLQPVVEQNVVTYVTVIDVPNRDLKLKPGMTATVTIEVAREEDTLRVPAAALRFTPAPELLQAFGGGGAGRADSGSGPAADASRRGAGDRARVWVLEGGQLASVAVRPGISDGAIAAIAAEGLQPGTLVVTGPGAQATAARATSASPLLPQRPGRGAARGAAQGGAR